MNNWAVVVEGIGNLREYDSLKDEIRFNAMRAINQTARDYRKIGAERIRAQINFPQNYFNPSAKRFYVSREATPGKLEARITARGRATSLARFVTSYTPGKKGVSLEVKTGQQTQIKGAFLIKLPAGKGPIDTKYNMGLAIRLRKGETLENKRNVRRMAKGLYILYGPSVDQVFLAQSGKGVAADLEPSILDDMETEFLRLMGY